MQNVSGGRKDELQVLLNTDLTLKKQMEAQAEMCLLENQVEVGNAEMAPKIGEPRRGDIELITNAHGIAMNTQVVVYQYAVSVRGYFAKASGDQVLVELTGKKGGDTYCIDRRDRCREIVSALKEQRGGCLHNKKCVYYDLQSILFSLDKLDMNSKVEMALEKDELPEGCTKFARCLVEIKEVIGQSEIRLGDLSGLNANLDIVEHSLLQFLDIATSQHAMFTPSEHVTFSAGMSFLMDPPHFGFTDQDYAEFPDISAYLGIGASKGVRYIEGPVAAGRTAAVVVQTKKTPFHFTGELLVKVRAFLRIDDLGNMREDERLKLEKFLKGLAVETSHSKFPQRFDIKSVAKNSARNMEIEVNGAMITVEQYFSDRYQFTLREPNAPLVVTGSGQNERYFPMELCKVCDNQRVKTNQQTPRMIQAAIRKCAVAPVDLLRQNEYTVESLRLCDKNNEYLSSADIQIMKRPMVVRAAEISKPVMMFGGNQQESLKYDCTWQGRKFLNPSGCEIWIAFAVLDHYDFKNFNREDFNAYLRRFVEDCTKTGMQMARPSDVQIVVSGPNVVDGLFQQAAGKFEFAFLIHSDNADEIHADIKFAERNYSIVTQAIKLSTLQNVVKKNKWQTSQNIVNKTNIKLAGLNYTLSPMSKTAVEVLKEDALYIGFASNHPGGGFGGFNAEPLVNEKDYPAPTVVGFAANVGVNGAFDFTGDFAYQEPLREEKYDVISKIVSDLVQMFLQSRQKHPERIFVYRNGCGEGQFGMVLKYEVSLIKMALRKLQCDAKLTIIAVNKLQNIRFFQSKIKSNQKPADQNIQPGTIIDHTVVHPVFSEFFLNSHRALQGTARTPKYTVLLDESKLPLRQLESMTYYLCYSHQIVFMPTSLPSPVFIANRYAERGRKLYQKFISSGGSRQESYDQLNERLGLFGNEQLCYRRVNA